MKGLTKEKVAELTERCSKASALASMSVEAFRAAQHYRRKVELEAWEAVNGLSLPEARKLALLEKMVGRRFPSMSDMAEWARLR